eukprot:8010040-Alexandrium_andersonii.AAC.1
MLSGGSVCLCCPDADARSPPSAADALALTVAFWFGLPRSSGPAGPEDVTVLTGTVVVAAVTVAIP